jgi:two-component system, sensor histidine kinase PdtaS
MMERGWTPAGLAQLVPDRLSTGMKMLLILTLALLPLGLIALFASIQSASANQAQRVGEAGVTATAEARQLDLLLLRGTSLARAALLNPARNRCRGLDERTRQALGPDARLALVTAGGQPLCGGSAASVRPDPAAGDFELRVDGAGGAIHFIVRGPPDSYAVGTIPARQLQRLLAVESGRQGLTISRGDETLEVAPAPSGGLFSRSIDVAVPIAGGPTLLRLDLLTNPISATEVILVLLPLLMWGAAAAIGWTVVDQLLLRPLAQLQRAIQDCGASGTPLMLPRLSTPSREIKALGESFQVTTAALIRREAELAEGLSHQVRLTREVHHRVKNNLQVVASLINLHARGTRGDVAAAYLSIQRRVDALAVVHRNHFAELEENRGVALRSIVAELTANLRGGVDPLGPQPTITLDMIPAFVSQDVAVPVAFLVTEIVELVLNCDPTGNVAVTLASSGAASRAILTLDAPGLSAAACRDHPSRERFERIVTGLARQLRSGLEFDANLGRYSIAIPIVPAGASA